MKENNIRYLVGHENLLEKRATKPFDEEICAFLEELSKVLLKDKRTASYPDIRTFAFYCRKANIGRLQKEFDNRYPRLGRGIVFHIAPSNVPINFMFSYVFGLLSGNSNIVRASTKHFNQTEIICTIINELLQQDKFGEVKKRTAIISYERNKEITDKFSSLCDARIIWGGDKTIEEIRKSSISSRTIEIAFADRFSLGIVNAEKIIEASQNELRDLAERFYNDTYLMDQNACSTPHLLVWSKSKQTPNAKNIFWEHVYKVASKYNLEEIKVSDKYTLLSKYAIELANIEYIRKYENLIYLVGINGKIDNITKLRGKFGLFFECELDNPLEIVKELDETVQTLAYYGYDREDIVRSVIQNSCRGVDRVVPFGKTLDIDVIWDGYDVIGQLSRIIG